MTSSPFKNLYILTGKGGVGKTSMGMGLTLALKNLGKKVIYSSFDQRPDEKLLVRLGIPFVSLDLLPSTQLYVEKKLGSKFIAKWILKTPFFHSLLEMIPGMHHMILLGHLVDMLESDKDLIIVIDSPSSGHALTMIESPINFREMFRSGPIVNDINRMLALINSHDKIEIIIATIATKMSLEEAKELKKHFSKMGIVNIGIILNSALFKNACLAEKYVLLPTFFQKKIDLEKQISQQYEHEIEGIIPFYISKSCEETVAEISKYFQSVYK